MNFQLRFTSLLFSVGMFFLVAADSQAQFNSGSYLGDWYNQALPSLPATQPAPSAFNPPATQNPSLLPANQRVRNWMLGVFVTNTDVGALVTNVQPNSPAAQAGLESQDLIVAVNGQQVGLVQGQLVDVGDQTSRSAVNGKVVALVADRRNGQLKNVPINLQQASNNIRGTVRLVDRVSLNPSYLTVSIRNVTRPYFEVFGGKSTMQTVGGGPFNFEMVIDPQTVYQQDEYRLSAKIEDANGNILYTTPQELAVNPSSNNSTPLVINLENYQQVIARNQTNSGLVVQASYSNQLDSEYQKILGRGPTNSERFYWTRAFEQGNTIEDLRVRLLSSPNFYDLTRNDPNMFVAEMIRILTGRQARNDEVIQWVRRLGELQGIREALVREYIARSSGLIR